MSKKILIIAGAIAGVAIVAGALIARHYFNVNKENGSVQIIGGADGPTSIFLAGKTGDITDEYIPGTDEQGQYIGQDKEAVGYYKRIGIAKADETYEEMLELQDIAKQGYLVVNEDGTAYFDLDGEKTEYTFDKKNFYLIDDTDKANGFSYTYIGGRLIISDDTTVTQYLRLTDEELEAYLESNE